MSFGKREKRLKAKLAKVGVKISINGKAFSSRNTRKKNFLSPQRELNPYDLPEYHWGLRKFFSEYFDLSSLLCYLHFIQVTNPFVKH